MPKTASASRVTTHAGERESFYFQPREPSQRRPGVKPIKHADCFLLSFIIGALALLYNSYTARGTRREARTDRRILTHVVCSTLVICSSLLCHCVLCACASRVRYSLDLNGFIHDTINMPRFMYSRDFRYLCHRCRCRFRFLLINL